MRTCSCRWPPWTQPKAGLRESTVPQRWSWNPTNGNIEAMYSNPSFDPNPLVSPNLTIEQFAWDTYLAPGGESPGFGYLRRAYPPGSSFKVVTTSAVLDHRPDLAKMTYPSSDLHSPSRHRDTAPGADQLPLRGLSGSNGPGTLEQLVHRVLRRRLRLHRVCASEGRPCCNRQRPTGSTSSIPLDVPADTVAASTMLGPTETTAEFDADIPGVMKSAIGQENVAATALQMAMVAGNRGQRRCRDDPPSDGLDRRLPGEPGRDLSTQAVDGADLDRRPPPP